jgi:hypothetical protein
MGEDERNGGDAADFAGACGDVPAAMSSSGLGQGRTPEHKIRSRSRWLANGLSDGEAVAGLGIRILAEGENLGRGNAEDQA